MIDHELMHRTHPTTKEITTRIEDQLARMSDEVTLTAIEAEQTLRALRIHLLMMLTEDDLR